MYDYSQDSSRFALVEETQLPDNFTTTGSTLLIEWYSGSVPSKFNIFAKVTAKSNIECCTSPDLINNDICNEESFNQACMFDGDDCVGCVMWRQTGSCDPNGPREPQFDRTCDVIVESGWSGYCECKFGNTMLKGCESGSHSTCAEACTFEMNSAISNMTSLNCSILDNATIGDENFCSAQKPCNHNEGDCDFDTHCNGTNNICIHKGCPPTLGLPDGTDCCIDACHDLIDIESGVIVSPNHPNDYLNDLQCAIQISVEAGKTIRIEFDSFSVSNHHFVNHEVRKLIKDYSDIFDCRLRLMTI